MPERPSVEPEGDGAFRVAFAGAISHPAMDAVRRFTAALEAKALPGVREIVPSYGSVTVYYDNTSADWRTLRAGIEALELHAVTDLPAARSWDIPVCYDEAYAPDLFDVAHMHGMTTGEVITMHSQAEYIVAAVGFVPGFAYLYGLPPALQTPRLASPRLRVPPGSVGIGGAQTGIYPLETPGGWRIIGNTSLRLFDAAREEPALLRAGDRVRFRPIGIEERVAAT